MRAFQISLLATFTFSAVAFSAACVGDSAVIPTQGSDASSDTGANNPDTSPPPGDASTADSGCVGSGTTDFFVDPVAGNDANGGGGVTCAFKTITAALIKSSGHYNATIHLAAGKYGAGETFPLVVDQGRSLVGADMATTIIQGSSTAFNTKATGSFLDEVDVDATPTNRAYVTILAGDLMGGTNKLGATTISSVTILPDATLSSWKLGYFGVACIAGNGPQTGANDPSKLNAANLVISNSTIGPNFQNGLVVGSSPANASGCNVSVTTSTFKGSLAGISTGACGTQNPSVSWPAARIGDGMIADANTFVGSEMGIFGGGCGSVQSFSGNKFVSGYRGIVLVANKEQYFEILSNTFDGATPPTMGIGLHMGSGSAVAKLNDNTFTNISYSAASATSAGGTTGYAIIMGGWDITQALRNSIHDNDNGLYVYSVMQPTFSFSAGGNVNNGNSFYCNSSTSLNGVGHDVITNSSGGNMTLDPFNGDHFDHQPVTTAVATNGSDIAKGTANITLSTVGGAAGLACAAGRVQ